MPFPSVGVLTEAVLLGPGEASLLHNNSNGWRTKDAAVFLRGCSSRPQGKCASSSNLYLDYAMTGEDSSGSTSPNNNKRGGRRKKGRGILD